MGTRADLIAGLQIIEKYYPGQFVCADHDIIYGGATDDITDQVDRDQLDKLGWFVDDNTGSWAFFT